MLVRYDAILKITATKNGVQVDAEPVGSQVLKWKTLTQQASRTVRAKVLKGIVRATKSGGTPENFKEKEDSVDLTIELNVVNNVNGSVFTNLYHVEDNMPLINRVSYFTSLFDEVNEIKDYIKVSPEIEKLV